MPTYSEDILRLAETTPVMIQSGVPTAKLANRLCGDRVSVGLDFDDERIWQVEWSVEGCAILKASAAYLARSLKGKRKDEAAKLILDFMKSFEQENEFRQGPMAAVYKIPARYKCAILPWQACQALLKNS
jgi:nitrogen fixation protein NifU and related proteins